VRTTGRPSRTRYVVLALLVLHYMNTYMDRVAISMAAPAMREEFGFGPGALGLIFAAFSLGYALFQIPGGWMADRFGPRRVLSGIVIYWSIFTIATAAAWSAGSLLVIRFLFGSGEAGAFPAATRAISRWFPSSERAFAQGVTHAGARFGAVITPPIAALMIVRWGWRSVFVLFGLLGFAWVVGWYLFYRDCPDQHDRVNASELAIIREGRGPGDDGSGSRPAVPWRAMLRSSNVRALCAMYFLYVYATWIFFAWFPTYLVETRQFSLLEAGLWSSLPLMAAVVGNSLGGWLSDRLVMRSGLRSGRRRVAIVGFVIAVVFLPLGAVAPTAAMAVACFSLAVGALELTTGVSWAVPVDIGRAFAGTISALMNTCGNLGGVLSALVVGWLVQVTGRWELVFLIAAAACLAAAVCWLRIDPEEQVELTAD